MPVAVSTLRLRYGEFGDQHSAITPARRVSLDAVGLIAANLAVYWRIASYQFLNFDDDWYVVNNIIVSHGFTWEGVRWALTALDYFYWQPLTWLSHTLDCQLFGLNPGSHHLTNLLIHVVNAGDSGALVLEKSTLKAVGLHFAGAERGNVFNPIENVLSTLHVELAGCARKTHPLKKK